MDWSLANVVLNITSAIAAYIAAMLWYKSAVVKVPYKDEPGADGFSQAGIIVDGNDFIATAIASSTWSKRAAYAAALAAFLQATAMAAAKMAAA